VEPGFHVILHLDQVTKSLLSSFFSAKMAVGRVERIKNSHCLSSAELEKHGWDDTRENTMK
jgi:hypothetical protein